MYNILIFSGGTGSIALQKGIDQVFGYNRVKVDIVINAYDNGKSTGECRRLFDYSILGPSDLRKNQLTQFSIKYAGELKNKNSIQYKTLELFELRMTKENYKDYYNDARQYLGGADFLGTDRKEYLIGLIDYFFFTDVQKGIWRRNIEKVDFTDFAVSNIFYSSCAVMNKCSLALAGSVMAGILGIANNVHLISHTPLLLSAYTESGTFIDDEGGIVTWNNKEDRITSVVLRDVSGNEVTPKVDGDILDGVVSVYSLVRDADIIIFSSGTQWSSLIPTYMHAGFSDMVSSSKATKYLIMNNREDADMKGVSSSGICRAVSKYLDLGGVKVVENNDAPSFMQREYSGLQYIHAPLGAGGKHDPEKLVCTIFVDYFGKDNINASTVMYDLDGTLWNDNGTPQEIEAGMENLKLYKGIIVSGNNYEHVRDVLMGHGNSETDGVYCFCNYGNTYFSTDEPDRVYDITNEFTIDRSVVDAFKMIPEYSGKLHLRGGAVLTIKPLEDRETQLARVMYIIGNNGGRYKADIAGRTSIDITRVEYGKATMIPRIAVMLGLDLSDCVFVGNEIDSGSEEGISRLGIGTVNVRDVFECNVFLKSWRMAHRTVEKADEGQCIAG